MHSIYEYTDIYQGLKIVVYVYVYVYLSLGDFQTVQRNERKGQLVICK